MSDLVNNIMLDMFKDRGPCVKCGQIITDEELKNVFVGYGDRNEIPLIHERCWNNETKNN